MSRWARTITKFALLVPALILGNHMQIQHGPEAWFAGIGLGAAVVWLGDFIGDFFSWPKLGG